VRWDPEQYRLEVLEPARRAGNVPPADLYVRYGLPGDIPDGKAFSGQIAEVVAYWQSLKSRRTYARLAETLLKAHADLERGGRLSRAKFAESQAHAHREQTERLSRLASAEAGAATHVGPVTVARLQGALGGSVSEAEVRKELRKAGVRVVGEFPELPARPHPKLADLVQQVQLLGLRLSTEVVFGDAVFSGFRVLNGFRLADGRSLDDRAITGARHRVDALPHSDPAKTSSENVLAILRTVGRNPAELKTLLLTEITERLWPFAESGFVQRAIAAQARDLGLDEDEAGLIAAAMLARNTAGAVRQQVEEELAASRLRSAQRLAAALPADDPLRQRVADRDAEVAALARRADEELAHGRGEQAARLLHEAAVLAGDDARLPERLAALPPPPPGKAAARVDGDHVLITWQASPALAGRVHYLVMRNNDRAPASPAEGTAVATRTERQDIADAQAPPGTALFYSVFATRDGVSGGHAWSPPAVTPSVIFTPEVTGLTVEASETAVAFSWRVHAGTETIIARRAQDHPPAGPDDGTAVQASLAGLTDRGLHCGTEYFYRIMASYRTQAGQRRLSAGVVVPVVPEPAPEPVTSLHVRLPANGSAGVVAAWAPVRHGQVRLARTGKPPRWPVGTRLTPDEAALLGQVSGLPRRGADGLDLLELRLPPGLHYLTALTAGGRTVVVGDSAEIALAEPVRDLSALRMQDAVRLSWIWPDDATDAVVSWAGGELRCSRRVYEDEGGVTVGVGAAETLIEVRAVYSHPGGELTAPAAQASVPGRGVTLNYRIHRVSRMHPRQRVVEIATEQPTRLPALVVVRATGPYAPDDPAEGEAVARIESQSIEPGQPVRVTVELPKGSGWLACFVDPSSARSDARGVLLFPPAAEEMRIR
jgi:hypothetical protein